MRHTSLKSVSVRGLTYQRLAEHAEAVDKSVAALLDQWVHEDPRFAAFLVEHPEVPIPRAKKEPPPKKAPRAKLMQSVKLAKPARPARPLRPLRKPVEKEPSQPLKFINKPQREELEPPKNEPATGGGYTEF
jgi:hypothetical protein